MQDSELTELYRTMAEGDTDAVTEGMLRGIAKANSKKNKSSMRSQAKHKLATKAESSKMRARAVKKRAMFVRL